MKKEKKIKQIKQTMWATVGFYKYQFAADDLRSVINRQAKIGLIPRGYLYPELHMTQNYPEVLRDVLKRKWKHQNEKAE